MTEQCPYCGVEFEEEAFETHQDFGCPEYQKVSLRKSQISLLKKINNSMNRVKKHLGKLEEELRGVNYGVESIKKQLMDEEEREKYESKIYNKIG